VTAVIIPLGHEPLPPSRDDWQPRVLRMLAASPGGVTLKKLRQATPSGEKLRRYLRRLEDLDVVKRWEPHCDSCRCHQVSVIDPAAVNRLLRESDPRPYSVMRRTAQIAQAMSETTVS
jgi:hypothetical protein